MLILIDFFCENVCFQRGKCISPLCVQWFKTSKYNRFNNGRNCGVRQNFLLTQDDVSQWTFERAFANLDLKIDFQNFKFLKFILSWKWEFILIFVGPDFLGWASRKSMKNHEKSKIERSNRDFMKIFKNRDYFSQFWFFRDFSWIFSMPSPRNLQIIPKKAKMRE